MGTTNFYDDSRFCATCQTYVRFLLSPRAAYCVECGGRVRIFSQGDLEKFRRTLSTRSVTSSGRVGLSFESGTAPRSTSTA